MNKIFKIYHRLYSFCAYNLFLYANFLLLFGLALNINFGVIQSIDMLLLPAYLLVGVGGYFLNDIFDEKSDTITQKFNLTTIVNRYLLLLIIIVFWSFGFFLIAEISSKASILLLIQYAFLMAYSVPFIRLKEKGFLGLIADALYAHVIPAIILLVIFQEHLSVFPSLWFLFLTFTFCLGLRDIAIHQLKDIANDTISGTVTFAVTNHKSIKSYIKFFNLCTVIALFAMLFVLMIESINIVFELLFYGLAIVYFMVLIKYKTIPIDSLIENYITISSVLFLYYFIASEYYFSLILLLHPYFLYRVRSIVNYIFITVIPLIANYFLYLFFLLLGRDLKQKPLYLRKKLKKDKG